MDPWGVFWNPPGSEHDKSATATNENNEKNESFAAQSGWKKLI